MFKSRGVIFFLVWVLLAMVCVNGYAQGSDAEKMSIPETSTPATQETADEETGMGTLEGTIKAVDAEQLTFKMSYPITFEFEELNFTILPMTEIIKNMNEAGFMDIQVGDRVIVDYIDDSSDPLKAIRVTLVGGYEE